MDFIVIIFFGLLRRQSGKHTVKMQRLYVLALYATKPAVDPLIPHEHEVSIRVAMTVASSDEEARDKATAQLYEWCPHEEGWINHHIALNVVSKEILRDLLAGLSEDPPSPESDQPLDWPDVIL